MSLTVINSNWTGAGPRETLTANETVFIGSGLSLISTSDYVLDSNASNIAAVVSSGTTLYANTGAIRFSNPIASNRSIEVEQGAVVSSAFYAVLMAGNNFNLENAGQISGAFYGIITELNNATHTGRIINSGQIIGGSSGITYNSVDFGTITLSNTGLIWGGNFSLESEVNTTYLITNRGEMRGEVSLGNLADVVDNVGGRINGTITMGGGNDILRPGPNIEVAVGGSGNDVLDFSNSGTVRVNLTTPASNTGAAAGDSYTEFESIWGSLTGSDNLTGDGVANTLKGQGGNDLLFGLNGADRLEGGTGNDLLDGGTGTDTMLGGAGNDRYFVDAAGDRVFETTTTASTTDAGGRDTVSSTISFDLESTLGLRFVENLTLLGVANTNGTGNGLANNLTGNSGNNSLSGGLGNDTLIGGLGNDFLNGALGKDVLTGGGGTDSFVFNTALSATNIDRITDFARGSDKILLDNAIFSAIAGGSLTAAAFAANTAGAATTAAHRIIYETDTGKVFYDANGSAAGGNVQVATLNPALGLTHTDFSVFMVI
ncbi:COG2931 RTX toxins and related Ca2+-binding proteins [Paracoccaceae bacterium]